MLTRHTRALGMSERHAEHKKPQALTQLYRTTLFTIVSMLKKPRPDELAQSFSHPPITCNYKVNAIKPTTSITIVLLSLPEN